MVGTRMADFPVSPGGNARMGQDLLMRTLSEPGTGGASIAVHGPPRYPDFSFYRLPFIYRYVYLQS